jgi:hypothetical protein
MTSTQRAKRTRSVLANETRRLTESDVASMPYSTKDARYQNRLAEAVANDRIGNSNKRKKLMAEEDFGYHKMPDGTRMKDSEHKAKKEVIKKAHGGKIDGKALKGKTKGRMV